MARRRSTEDKLRALGALRARPAGAADDDDRLESLTEALGDRSAAVVSKAAEIVGELGIEPLVDALAAAFARLLEGGIKADPGCLGKTAIVRALHRFADPREDVFLAGLVHVQLEPVYGGRKDTAAELRGISALALAATPYPDAAIEIGERLADPEVQARVGAARALGALGRREGAGLIRLRLASGEDDPDVVGEAVAALLELTPEGGVAFLGRWLADAGPLAAEAAILAVGNARPPGAFALLRGVLDGSRDRDLRSRVLLALALLRDDAALDFLLQQVADAPGPDARDALAALGTFHDDEKLAGRVREIVVVREDVDLASAFEQAFP